MKIQFHGAYVSKKGTATFRYTVQGTKEELANYKKVQGENYREDEATKSPLFFAIKRYSDNTELSLTRDGKRFYAVTELLEKVVENQVIKFKAMAHILETSPKAMLQRMMLADDDI
jgi:hypothetical protein